MRLPHAEHARIDARKITQYLLSPVHRVGRHKAEFFTAVGFSRSRSNELAEALLQHARQHEVAKTEESLFGLRYVVDGIMETPDGRRANVRSVWFVRSGEDAPWLVTAYPVERSKR